MPEHDVYITDWTDARDVPMTMGAFGLDDYTEYLIEFCQFLAEDGERPAVMAVCHSASGCLSGWASANAGMAPHTSSTLPIRGQAARSMS